MGQDGRPRRPGRRRTWYGVLGVVCALAAVGLLWRTVVMVGDLQDQQARSGAQTAPPDVRASGSPRLSEAPAPAAPPEVSTAPTGPASATGLPTAAPVGEDPRDAEPLAGRVVAVDPGHNGRNGQHVREITRQVDAGGFAKDCNTTGTATDDGHPESAVNWAIAQELTRRLEDLGARVVLTRADDAGWGPCVDERALVANRAGADLLLSIHADGAPAGERGFHVIAPGSVAPWTDDIVADSARLARQVRDALVRDAGLPPSTYVGADGLDVRTDLGTLNRSDVPAVMVEAGNLRNTEDAALLTSSAGQAAVAEALARAVVEFTRG